MKYSILILSFLCLSIYAHAQSDTFPEGKRYAYKYNGTTIFTEADRIPGISYRVEVMRIPFYNEKDPGLKLLKKYGDLSVAYWPDSHEYVLTVGAFDSEESAESLKDKLRADGFMQAKVIKYLNGLRQ